MINTLANLLFLNNKASWKAGESLIPNTETASAEKHLGHTLHHSSSNREGTEPNLGTAELPMSRGDKETDEVATTESHNGTYPEQSQAAVQYFLHRWRQNPVHSVRSDAETGSVIYPSLCMF